ncbi:MAG: prepilin-type N-terminal cleavage/methylation domain-containing protein [Planctomycetes bacterium]|nr:prepilin-type N-terminal cleavage/methylation domain-containing protein [Planctomycetota bacterium]
MPRRAFTLIEMLVVVTIITLLMAILTPSLSKARYTARLTICAAQEHQISLAALSYAAGNFGVFPYRSTCVGLNPKPFQIKYYDEDDRPMFAKYFSFDTLQCPFNRFTDPKFIETTTADEIMLGYEMYFGTSVNRNDPASYMFRLSDRPTTPDLWTGKRTEVSVLVADLDVDWFWIQNWYSSHPDREPSKLRFIQALGTSPPGDTHTFARWGIGPPGERGLIDRNFIFRDGSHRLITDIAMHDDRLARISANNQNAAQQVYTYVPLR